MGSSNAAGSAIWGTSLTSQFTWAGRDGGQRTGETPNELGLGSRMLSGNLFETTCIMTTVDNSIRKDTSSSSVIVVLTVVDPEKLTGL